MVMADPIDANHELRNVEEVRDRIVFVARGNVRHLHLLLHIINRT